MHTSHKTMCGRRWKSSTRSRSRKSAPNLPQITILNGKKRGREPGKNRIPLLFPYGAEGGTRTPTGFPTTPSRWRVYQVPPLRHARENHLIRGEGENQEGKGYQKRRDIRVAIGFRRPPWSVQGGCFRKVDGKSPSVVAIPPQISLLLARKRADPQ